MTDEREVSRPQSLRQMRIHPTLNTQILLVALANESKWAWLQR